MHLNHILTLRKAREYGDYLIVGVASDERMRLKKGKNRPFIPEKERAEILRELRCVDEVVIIGGKEDCFYGAVDMIRPDIALINITEKQGIQKMQDFCNERNVKLERIERIDDHVSTTKIIQMMKKSKDTFSGVKIKNKDAQKRMLKIASSLKM